MNLSGASGKPDIIFDNGVLSNFALSEAYPIIETLYANTAYVTDFVAAENKRKNRASSVGTKYWQNNWIP